MLLSICRDDTILPDPNNSPGLKHRGEPAAAGFLRRRIRNHRPLRRRLNREDDQGVQARSFTCRVGSFKVTADRLPIVLQIGVKSGSRGQLGSRKSSADAFRDSVLILNHL